MNDLLFGQKKPSTKTKENYDDLEDKIFEQILLNSLFKGELQHPLAVLEKQDKKVILGANLSLSQRINDSIMLQIELDKIVSKTLGGIKIKAEVMEAKSELAATVKRINKKILAEKKEEGIRAEIKEQKDEGRCSLIPFPLDENKVRSDLTIERHALFAANTFKGDFRIYERKIKDHETGEASLLRVEIGDVTGRIRGAGVLKQKHQEAFYKLSQAWEEKSYQIKEKKKSLSGFIEFSLYELVQRLRGDSGGRTYKQVLQLLTEMSTIRVNIKKLNSKNRTSDIQDFTILSYEWSAKDFNEETLGHSPGCETRICIHFSDFITNNFLRKNVKPLMLDPYLSLEDKGRKGTAQLLYTMLDYELSSKDKFNISLIALCERLGLSRYKYKSDRKRILKSPINNINGKEILNGKYKIGINLSEAQGGGDWVLTAYRV